MIKVCEENFNLADEYQALCCGSKVGAIVTFVGLVRDFSTDEGVTGLKLQHYPGMTEKLLAEIVDEAKHRWDIYDIRIIHRVGQLYPEDQIVFVGVNSAHRKDAFDNTEIQYQIDGAIQHEVPWACNLQP